MLALTDRVVATVVLLVVTTSFPCFLYGAWIMIDNDPVTWDVLTRHLKFIGLGLTLTTVPILVWMLPRLPGQFSTAAVVHAMLGAQAYAMLAFAITGVVRVFRAKWHHDLYADADRGEYDGVRNADDLLLADLGLDNIDHWRWRIRIGVLGYVGFWVVAYTLGFVRYLGKYPLF